MQRAGELAKAKQRGVIAAGKGGGRRQVERKLWQKEKQWVVAMREEEIGGSSGAGRRGGNVSPGTGARAGGGGDGLVSGIALKVKSLSNLRCTPTESAVNCAPGR